MVSNELTKLLALLLFLAEKRTACLEEVRVLKETDSVQFLNELDTSPPCKATLALTGAYF